MLIFCIAVDFNRYYEQSRDEENNFLEIKIIKLIFHISRPKLTLIGVGVKTKNAGIAIISSSSPHYGYERGHFLLSYL